MDGVQESYGKGLGRAVGAVQFLQPAEYPQAGNDCIWSIVNRVGIPGSRQEALKVFRKKGHGQLSRHTPGPLDISGIPENINVHQAYFKRPAGQTACILCSGFQQDISGSSLFRDGFTGCGFRPAVETVPGLSNHPPVKILLSPLAGSLYEFYHIEYLSEICRYILLIIDSHRLIVNIKVECG